MKKRIQFARLLLFPLIAIASLAFSSVGWTQAASAIGSPASGQPTALLITIIDGEGALNDIRTRTAREPIVEVDDENHKPVAGALVLFSLDKSGSSHASFNGVRSVSVQTDAAGRATAKGFQITQHKGSYSIAVHATFGELVADAAIAQSNVDGLSSQSGGHSSIGAISHKKLEWLVGSAVVGGVIAGIVVATHQSSPTTISPGTATVGAPSAVRGIHIQLLGHNP